MELIFTKQADRWVAEFIANNDFNLHIEGVVEGNVSVFQRGSESGNYAFVKEGTPHPSYANVYDYDFAALIYPKFIKVSCATEPTSGIVTSDGEITEIKAQSKEIEVTSNGTTEVTPDAGFAYLNSVKVKTNVAQSGGGGGSASTMEYFLAEGIHELSAFASVIKLHNEEENYMRIVPASAWATGEMYKSILVAVGLDLQSEYIGPEPFNGKLLDIFVKMGLTKEAIAAIPRITEEEFYNLDNGGGIA